MPSRSFLGALWAEMHRRKVGRVAGAYALVAWILMQLGEVTFGPLQLPERLLTVLILGLILGFPLAVALAWSFEITPDGVRREKLSADSRKGLGFVVIGGAVLFDLFAGYGLYQVYAPTVEGEPEVLVAGIPDNAANLVAQQTAPAATVNRPTASAFEIQSLYVEARQLWRERTPESLDLAIATFKEIIEKDPQYAPAYSGLADSLLLQANYGNLSMADAIKEAQSAVEMALNLDGQLAEGFASLGLLHWNLGRFRKAKAYFERAIRLDVENATPARMWLGSMLGQQGRVTEERLLLEEAWEHDKRNPLIKINLAWNAAQRGDPESGHELLEELLATFPTNGMVLRTMAAWVAQRSEFARAIALLQRASEVSRDEPVNLASLAHIYLTLGEVGQAAAVLQDAREIGSDNEAVVMAYARYLLRTDRLDELRRFASGRLETSSNAMVATKDGMMPRFWLAQAAFQENQWGEAMENLAFILHDAELLPPAFAADALTWRATAEYALQEESSAVATLEQVDSIIKRLKIQGVQSPELLYLEACWAALSGKSDIAMDNLAAVSEAVFLEVWQLEQDQRLSTLHNEPRFAEWMTELRAETAAVQANLSQQVAAQ